MSRALGELARFCLVGAVGFVVDTSITLLLVTGFGWSPLPARLVAFIAGATATWLLNMSFTFRASGGWRRWGVYMGLSGVGALLNVGVYSMWVWSFGIDPVQLLAGIAAGAACALVFNFAVSKYIVFAPARTPST